MHHIDSTRYLEVLQQELIPALGCTEPIAIAYAAAVATKELGMRPERLHAACSPNIVKNVKGVTVPNSGGLKGIKAAAILGALGGDPDRGLEVLQGVTPEIQRATRELAATQFCSVDILLDSANLHIVLTASAGDASAEVEIKDTHTNIWSIRRNGELVFQAEDVGASGGAPRASRDFITAEGIYDFALHCRLEDVRPILERQITLNTAISKEGLQGSYGAGVGRLLMDNYGDNPWARVAAAAAAGSDARMNGCGLPVVINSGSGNQGLTASLPVIEYARGMGVSEEKMLRALVLSNLMAIHQKTGIGKLSAYCGVVSAACGSAAAITYLHDGTFQQISDTMTNMLATLSGMVCDGAKSSCASKIAAAVHTGLLAHTMAMQGIVFKSGDGIVKGTLEQTIQGVGRMARIGMRSTDEEILHIMLEED